MVEQSRANYELSSPESLAIFFSTLWRERLDKLKKAGVKDLFVEDCPYSQEALLKLEMEGRRVGYLPEQFSSQQSRPLLGVIWPEMSSFSLRPDNVVTNEKKSSGWFDYEISIGAAYLDSTEDELRQEAKKQGREGLTLNQYIIAGQDSKVFSGQYLDEVYVGQNKLASFSRLLGSFREGRTAHARFHPDGGLDVPSPIHPWVRLDSLGGRLGRTVSTA